MGLRDSPDHLLERVKELAENIPEEQKAVTMLQKVDCPQEVILLLLDGLVDVAQSETLENSLHAGVSERHLGI